MTETVKIPDGSKTLLGGDTTVSALMEDGATVAADGTVTATLHNVKDFEEFSTVLEEQSGHYFAFMLDGSISGDEMTLKKNGVSRPDKEGIPFDPEIIVRLESKSDTLEISVDGNTVITLKFSNCTFEE